MIIVLLILLLFAGGLLAWLSAQLNSNWPRWISLISLLVGLYILAGLSGPGNLQNNVNYGSLVANVDQQWWLQFNWPWIERFGIGFQLGLDGLSYLLLVLT